MSKRFTDTEIWEKSWFMELSLKHKCLIRFLFDKCDAAGVWQPNLLLASVFIGERVTKEDFEVLKDQIEYLPNGKIFIKDFVKFQYGELTSACPPHRKVIALLKNYGLLERVTEGYYKGNNTLQEEEEYKEEEKEKEKEGGITKGGIPDYSEFEEYAEEKALEFNIAIDAAKLKAKYNAWKEAGWRTGGSKSKGGDRAIKNWKSTLCNTINFLQPETGLKKEKRGAVAAIESFQNTRMYE
ncbi:MAG TPA: hypothetical protein VD907_06805 [Verrucomicrobiae bacterium]|nr:hypothetical protein [Verrucomicrobiae bacterium]